MTPAILICTNCASAEEAERISAAVIERRLAACASLGAAVVSRFRWEGKVETATEVPLTIKTQRDGFDGVAAVIRSLHSYQVPEIIALPIVDTTPEYVAWLAANTQCTPLD